MRTMSAATFFTAFGGAAFLHFVYLLLMARFLGVEDYGVLLALLSIFTLASLPATGLDLLATKVFAPLRGQSSFVSALRQVTMTGTAWSLAAAAIILLLSTWLYRALSIPDLGLIVMVALMVMFSYVQAVGWGILRGRQRFFLLSLSMLLYPVVRVALGIVLVLSGLRVTGAVLGSLLAVVITAASALLLGTFSRLPGESRVAGKADGSDGNLPATCLRLRGNSRLSWQKLQPRLIDLGHSQMVRMRHLLGQQWALILLVLTRRTSSARWGG